MKILHQSDNALEAQVLLDVLLQEGISGQVLGQYLRGAVGELPAGTLIRLVVDEADYAAAREVIDRWESAIPIEEPE